MREFSSTNAKSGLYIDSKDRSAYSILIVKIVLQIQLQIVFVLVSLSRGEPVREFSSTNAKKVGAVY